MPKAADLVIVDDALCLHPGIPDGGPNKLEAARVHRDRDRLAIASA
jgi:hypothetical protein